MTMTCARCLISMDSRKDSKTIHDSKERKRCQLVVAGGELQAALGRWVRPDGRWVWLGVM